MIALQWSVALAVLCWGTSGRGEDAPRAAPTRLSLDEAYRLALKSAPGVGVTRTWRAEAEAGRVEAEVFPRQNPVFEVAAGPKIVLLEATPTASLSLMQAVDLGGGVGARVARVDAEVARADASGALATQAILRDVGLAFVRVLWANEQLAQADALQAYAEELAAIGEKRRSGGDTSRLELSVSTLGVARARAERARCRADRDAALGRLHALLGVPLSAPLEPTGSLEALTPLSLADLEKRAEGRPDVQALAADLRAAQADRALAGALAAPQLGFGARWDHEEDTDTVQGVLSLTLPIFDHAQGLAARAEASERRARAELEARQAVAPIALRAAWDAYEARVEAVRALGADAPARVDEALALAKRSYEAGETSLSDLMALRRELVEVRRARLDLLRDAREASIELAAEAGVLP